MDHHATDVAAEEGADLIHDVSKSAGLLCYELCREHGLASPELDRLVHLNNVGDLFLEDDPEFILANDYANLVKIYRLLEPARAGGRPNRSSCSITRCSRSWRSSAASRTRSALNGVART